MKENKNKILLANTLKKLDGYKKRICHLCRLGQGLAGSLIFFNLMSLIENAI
ncbi:hypothetical protein [Campylobacter curvus]|uniref:hypothetical protein n=1 Tax=Campylobacter curvus TaxID=200 RepID=UPI0020160638|nr:hypothetical protein [Campylobacter curvus]